MFLLRSVVPMTCRSRWHWHDPHQRKSGHCRRGLEARGRKGGVGSVNTDMVPYGRNDADRTVARFQAPVLSGALELSAYASADRKGRASSPKIRQSLGVREMCLWPDSQARITLGAGCETAAKSGRFAHVACPLPPLAIPSACADIGRGRLAVDGPLANRVRSGRKQP